MTAGADSPEPTKREFSLPTERLASLPPDLNLTSILGNERTAPRDSKGIYRNSLSQDFQLVQGPLTDRDPGQIRARRMTMPQVEGPGNTGVGSRLRQYIQRNQAENTMAMRPGSGPDRMALTRQLLRTLHIARGSAENSRKNFVAGRGTEDVASDKNSAERKAQQQAKAVEVAKRAKSMIALIKSNPEAVAKLASIVDTAQGENLPNIFASAIVDAGAMRKTQDNASEPQTDKGDVKLAANVATQLAERSPEFAAKLGQAILQQTELAQSDPVETIRQSSEQLAQILKQPENRILLESVVTAAVREPQSPSNVIILQEIAKADPAVVERNPQIASIIQSDPVAMIETPLADTRVASTQPLESRGIKVASLDLSTAFSGDIPVQATREIKSNYPIESIQVSQSSYAPQMTADLKSYINSPELPQMIEDCKHVANNFNPSTTILPPYRPNQFDIGLEAVSKNAALSEIYSNPNMNLQDIRDSLNAKLNINETSKFTFEIQNTDKGNALVFTPTPRLIQEIPEMSQSKIIAITEADLQSARQDVQKLEKFIADINTTSDASVATQFADFSRNSTNSLNTVLAFRQVIMSIARSSGLSGPELAQKIKDDLNLGLQGGDLSIEAEVNTVLLNTVVEGMEENGKMTLAEVKLDDAPDGTLTTEQIERIKTELVAAIYDPFKLAHLEQRLLHNGVSQSEISELKTRAMENPQVEPVISDEFAATRIRNDVRDLVSTDEFERQTAAEDLARNNLSLVSAENGALSFSIERESTATKVSVWAPGEQPNDQPTSVEMYSFGPNEKDNRNSPVLNQIITAASSLDWDGIKLDVIDANGKSIAVRSMAPVYDSSMESEDEGQVSTEPAAIEQNYPNFSPYEYIDPSLVQAPQRLDLNQEQEQIQYQEEEQYPQEAPQDQHDEYTEEVDEEIQQEVPEEIQGETQGNEYQGAMSEQDVMPNLQDLFSNDMRKRASAALTLTQGGAEIIVENENGTFKVTVEQGVHPIAQREMFVVKLQDTRSGEQASIAEMYIENGQFAKFPPPNPPAVILAGARVTCRIQGRAITVPGEQLLGR